MNPAPFRHGRLARFALAIVAVLMVTACGDSGPAKRAPVVVLGVDGAEWNVINDMIADGELPHFKQLRDEAAHGGMIADGSATGPTLGP